MVEIKIREIIGIILTLSSLITMMLIVFIGHRKLILFVSLLAIGVIMAMIGIKGEKFLSSLISALLIILGEILCLLAVIGMWYIRKIQP